jgi:hypothetical protein
MKKVAWDIQILHDDVKVVQKTINQWKHQYKLKTTGWTFFADGKCSVAITRIEKSATKGA